jgi:hypothetical protein
LYLQILHSFGILQCLQSLSSFCTFLLISVYICTTLWSRSVAFLYWQVLHSFCILHSLNKVLIFFCNFFLILLYVCTTLWSRLVAFLYLQILHSFGILQFLQSLTVLCKFSLIQYMSAPLCDPGLWLFCICKFCTLLAFCSVYKVLHFFPFKIKIKI